MSVLLVVLACESLHVCTVCIWRCEHARFCVEVFYAQYINFHSFIHVCRYLVTLYRAMVDAVMAAIQLYTDTGSLTQVSIVMCNTR